MLEETCPPEMPTESVSTTHRDHCAGGCQFMPLPTTQVQAGNSPPTPSLQQPPGSLQGFHVPPGHAVPPCPLSHCFHLQPHNYCTEQPCSFWLEQARSLPVSPPAPCPASTRGTRLLTGTSLLPSPPECHQHPQRGQSLSEERSLLHSHHRVPRAAPALCPPEQPAPAPQAIKSRGAQASPASLLPQGCPQAGHLEREHSVPGILIPTGPCSRGLGTSSSPSASHCYPKTCYGPKPPSSDTEGEPRAQPCPLGCALSRHPQWVTRSPCPRPQAQVGSSKRWRQRHGQSMRSEECSAALMPKQTPQRRLCLPSAAPSPRQPPCTGSPCPDPCPVPQLDPRGTTLWDVPGSWPQPRRSSMLGSPPAPPTPLGALGQSEAEVKGHRDLGKFVFQQNSLQ